MVVVLRPEVKLGLKRMKRAGMLAGATYIHAKMSENAPIFLAPVPSMAILGAQLADALAANLQVRLSKAAAGMRDMKCDILWSSLQSERAAVQILVDASPEKALLYAAAAGMKLVEASSYRKPILDVELTTTPGTVVLVANASLLDAPGKGRSLERLYLWRYLISGALSYVNADPTPVAHTVIANLPLNTEIGFEVAVKDSKGTGAWSQTFTLFVR